MKSIVSELFSANATIIDYRPFAREIQRWFEITATKNPVRNNLFLNIADYFKCESFIKSYLNTSKKKLVTNSYDKSVSWLKNQNFDSLIVGSDEIWKISQGNKRLYTLFFERPFPNLYFLDTHINCLKISYAASIGKTDIGLLPSFQRKKLADLLSSFDYLSVRDDHTKSSLESLGINRVFRVPDPTLICEIPLVKIKNKLIRCGVDFGRPLLGIHHGSQKMPIFRAFCKKFTERGFQIVSPVYSPYADINLKGKLTPFEYYSMYMHFTTVLTSSFHSTVFSLKHGVPFITIDISPHRNIEGKTRSLLKDFSCLNRLVDGNEIPNQKNFDAYLEPINKEAIQKQINVLKQDGLNFLSLALRS